MEAFAMRRYLPGLLGMLIALLVVGGPLSYCYYRQTQMRNFHAVRDGVLYRSGQMTVTGLKTAIHDYGIKTVITLRDAYYPDNAPPDFSEEDYCAAEEITYCRIAPRNWWAPDGSVPAEEGVQRFRAIMDDPVNYPVLIHCFGGIHRTGAFCAIYRMEYEHWSNDQAIAEMRACGYKDLDDEWDLLTYLEQYRPRWKLTQEPAITSQGTWTRTDP
jgi:protein tyrosine/serine phosphatase